MTIDVLPAYLRERYEERAAIMEHDGGLSRERAEAEAMADVLRLMGECESEGGESD